MDQKTVFTKTAKGITQVNQKSASLSRDLMKVLKLIDGKSNYGQIMEKADMDKPNLEKALTTLTKDGFARIFEVRKEEADPFAGEDDFDFTAPGKLPGATQRVIAAAANDISELARQHERADTDKKSREQANVLARQRATAQAEARAKAEADAKAKVEAEKQAMEQVRRAKEAAERAKAELEAKMREEEERKRAMAEHQARLAAEANAKEEEAAKRAAEMRAKAEAEALALSQAKAKAEAEAQALAQVKARATAELQALAKARADAEDAAKRAETQVRSTLEAEARLKAEAESKAIAAAKAREEAELRAMAEARRAQEAIERAQAELAARMRDEEAKRRAEDEKAAKLAAQEMAKVQEESRNLAEIRAKAEGEAKALAEARQRAEAEAAALARARAEAEATVKRQVEEAAKSEKELKARLKEEIETRIRAEMEILLRDEIEEKARAELQVTIMAEAKLAARAELEERLQEEREVITRVESEARGAAEKAARERADQESKLRAEAEARFQAESTARQKAEEETRRLRAREQIAQQEAEAAALEKKESAKRLEAERRAKIEAEARAMVEAEERERREKELQGRIDTERKAKEEAELRVKIESRARETIAEDTRAKVQAELENDMEKRAEIEGKAQAKAYMDAKKKAELDEDSRQRDEQEQKARHIADIMRTRVEPDQPVEAMAKRRPRRRRAILKPLLYGTIAILVIGVALLHVVPLRGFANKLEKAMGGWMHDNVSISSLKFSLVPSPHLKLEGIAAGKLLDAKANSGRVYLDIMSLFEDKIIINLLELDNVSINGDAVNRILTWGKVEGKAAAATIDQIRLKGVTLDVKPVLKPFDATLNFTKDGVFRGAALAGGDPGRWSVNLRRSDSKGYAVDFYARSWELPLGAAMPVSEVKATGMLTDGELLFPEFEADAMEGKVNGTLKVSWGSGLRLASDIALQRVRAEQLVSAFTKDIAVTGRLEGNFTLAAESAELATLLVAPRAQGKFRVTDGSFSNTDLVAALQSASTGRAGVTKFTELTGEMASGEQRVSYRNIVLSGGVIHGNAAVDIAANSVVSGRVLVELRSSVAADRGSFNLSGTVAKPVLKRGG